MESVQQRRADLPDINNSQTPPKQALPHLEFRVLPSQRSPEEHNRTNIGFECGAFHTRRFDHTNDSRSSSWVTTRFVFNCSQLLPASCQVVQSINIIENSHFRELLLYLGQGHVTDDEIPGQTCLTESIIKAWKQEREQFHQEMKVRCRGLLVVGRFVLVECLFVWIPKP